MKQWQVVKHNIEGEVHYSLSLVNIKDNMMTFIMSIDLKTDDKGKHVVISNLGDCQSMSVFDPSEFAEFVLDFAENQNLIISYEVK